MIIWRLVENVSPFIPLIRLSVYFIKQIFIDLPIKYPRTHHVEVAGTDSHPTPAQPLNLKC